jgi:hypothetical protein
MTTLTPEQVRANQNNKWFPVPNLPRSAYVEPPRSEYLRTLPRQAPRGFLEGSDSSLLGQAVVSQTRSKEALMISQDIRFETDRALEEALGREYIIPKKKKKDVLDEMGDVTTQEYIPNLSATDLGYVRKILDFGRQRAFMSDVEENMTGRLLRQMARGNVSTKVLQTILELLEEKTPHGGPGFLEDPSVYRFMLAGLVKGDLTTKELLELRGDVTFEEDFETAQRGMELEAEEEEMYRNPFEPSMRPPTLRETWQETTAGLVL